VIGIDSTCTGLNISLVKGCYDVAYDDYTLILKIFLALVKMMRELKEHSDI
jgi:hypothetical protein